jgi:hypothetical protein
LTPVSYARFWFKTRLRKQAGQKLALLSGRCYPESFAIIENSGR